MNDCKELSVPMTFEDSAQSAFTMSARGTK